MHNLKCQRNVYMRIQSIKQQFIRCDDNMPYNSRIKIGNFPLNSQQMNNAFLTEIKIIMKT